jgi:hypothetical protein
MADRIGPVPRDAITDFGDFLLRKSRGEHDRGGRKETKQLEDSIGPIKDRYIQETGEPYERI